MEHLRNRKPELKIKQRQDEKQNKICKWGGENINLRTQAQHEVES